MTDTMDRLLTERQSLDQGMSVGVAFSFIGHMTIVLFGIVLPFLLPKPPIIQMQEGILIPMPPGGGGVRNAAPGNPKIETTAPTAPAAPDVQQPPKVLKPPVEQPRRGIPEPDGGKRTKQTPAQPASGYPGGTGTTPGTPGLEFAPPGPGVPGGTDLLGDFYLAGVQRKIWMIWVQQLRSDARNAVIVGFTILANGSVTDVHVVQSSGVTLLDMAAQRSVASASPFSPLPEHYGTNRFTIHATFRTSF
ncbi:MAG: TonB C-terminal domain-containing protein [Vicinamibacteria bacterium]|nr:TonB C-terminal domain-containing protein [Vicinamibacteria bacterium]